MTPAARDFPSATLMSAAPARPLSKFALAIVLLTYFLGALFRYEFIFVTNRPTDPSNIFGDIDWYVYESAHYFDPSYHSTLYDTLFPPGMAIYIATLRWLNPSLQLLVVMQWVLACLIPFLLGAIALRLFGSRNAAYVLCFSSLYFPLWEYFGYLFSEGPFLFSMLAAFLLLIVSLQYQRLAFACLFGALGGIFLGAASALKSVALLSAAVSFAALLFCRRRAVFRIWPTFCTACLGVVVVLTPISRHATRLNEGRFLLIANDASRTFLLGHQGRAGLTWWVDAARDFHMNFINPSTVQHNYTAVKTYPFGVYDNAANYAAGWRWTLDHPVDALLLSFEHVFDMFAIALPYPGYFRPYFRWVGFFNEIFLTLVFLPAIYHLVRSRRRILLAEPAMLGDALLAAAASSIYIVAFFYLGEGRYRICYDGFLILLASRAIVEPGSLNTTVHGDAAEHG
ncbi:MAG: hypothetical protein U0136_21400 [Bdellovibrionota bacterium]